MLAKEASQGKPASGHRNQKDKDDEQDTSGHNALDSLPSVVRRWATRCVSSKSGVRTVERSHMRPFPRLHKTWRIAFPATAPRVKLALGTQTKPNRSMSKFSASTDSRPNALQGHLRLRGTGKSRQSDVAAKARDRVALASMCKFARNSFPTASTCQAKRGAWLWETKQRMDGSNSCHDYPRNRTPTETHLPK